MFARKHIEQRAAIRHANAGIVNSNALAFNALGLFYSFLRSPAFPSLSSSRPRHVGESFARRTQNFNTYYNLFIVHAVCVVVKHVLWILNAVRNAWVCSVFVN